MVNMWQVSSLCVLYPRYHRNNPNIFLPNITSEKRFAWSSLRTIDVYMRWDGMARIRRHLYSKKMQISIPEMTRRSFLICDVIHLICISTTSKMINYTQVELMGWPPPFIRTHLRPISGNLGLGTLMLMYIIVERVQIVRKRRT